MRRSHAASAPSSRVVSSPVLAALALAVGVGAPASAQTVVDILPAGSSSWGLAYHDGSLWVGDDGDGRIHQVDPADGTELGVIGTPYDEDTISFGANHGVTWDGSAFWVAGDYNKDWLYRVSMAGTTLDSIPSPTDAVGGLGFDGTNLVVTSYFPNEDAGILIVDPADGTILEGPIPAQGEQPYGIDLDPGDGTFWNGMDDNDGDAELIWNLALDGTPLSSFDAPAQSPKGLCFGDGFLWIVANNIGGAGRRIYKIDPAGGGTPDIAADPDAYDYGIVPVDETPSYTQTLRNDGDGDLTITSITDSAIFDADLPGFPLVIPPAGEASFDVTFHPGLSGLYAGSLTVESDDIDEPTVTIDLTATAVDREPTVSTTPAVLAFDDTGVGLARGIALTIENVGFEDLTVTGVASDDTHFQVATLLGFPQVLGTFESITVQVVFEPDAAGPSGATITVSSDDPDTPADAVAASGTGEDRVYAGGDVVWFAPGIENVVTCLALPDVTGDGIFDALMETYDAGADGDPVQAFRGNSDENGVPIYSLGEGGSGGWGDQGLALHPDTDDDGHAEVIRGVAWGGRRVELRGSEDGEVAWSFDTSIHDDGGWVYSVASMPDVSGDGVPEVAACAGTSGGPGTGSRRIYGLDGATGAMRFAYIGPDAFNSVVVLDDVSGDDVVDLAGGNANGTVYAISGAATGLAPLLWTFDTGDNAAFVDVIEDVSGDGVNDVIAGSWSNQVFCIDGVLGTEVWSSTVGGDVLKAKAVPDMDGDGIQDVAVCHIGSGFRVLSGVDGSNHWIRGTGGNVWSIDAIPDVDGDGVTDVIAGAQDDLVYCVSGASSDGLGEIIWTRDLDALVFTVRAIPDVTGNGVPDVLAGTQDLDSPIGGRLWCLEGNGTVVAVDDPAQVAPSARFLGVRPNPMRGAAAFGFDVRDDAASIEVTLFAADGRRVRTLSAGGAGARVLDWDGRDDDGRDLAAGIYFYTVRIHRPGHDDEVRQGKLTRLR